MQSQLVSGPSLPPAAATHGRAALQPLGASPSAPLANSSRQASKQAARAPNPKQLLPQHLVASQLQGRQHHSRRQRCSAASSGADWTAAPAAASTGTATDGWQQAEQQQQQQQSGVDSNGASPSSLSAAGKPYGAPLPEAIAEPYDISKTRALVETAMLASITGLAYLLASIIKVEGYLGYLLPLPIVVAAMRSGPSAARKTMTATCFLLMVLLGPIRMVTYFFMHGMFACCMGLLWSAQCPWALSVPLGAAVRVVGTIGYLTVSSWTLNENLVSLIITNVFSFLDQILAIMGISGAPSLLVVVVTMASLLAVNSLFYVFLMHCMYALILRQMGYQVDHVPAMVQRLLYRQVAMQQ